MSAHYCLSWRLNMASYWGLRLCLPFIQLAQQLFLPPWKAIWYGMNSNSTELEQVIHKRQTSDWSSLMHKSRSSISEFYLCLNGFQSSFLLIYFGYSLNTSRHKVLQKPFQYVTIYFQDLRGATLLWYIKIALKLLFLWAMRSPAIWCTFHVGPRAISCHGNASLWWTRVTVWGLLVLKPFPVFLLDCSLLGFPHTKKRIIKWPIGAKRMRP